MLGRILIGDDVCLTNKYGSNILLREWIYKEVWVRCAFFSSDLSTYQIVPIRIKIYDRFLYTNVLLSDSNMKISNLTQILLPDKTIGTLSIGKVKLVCLQENLCVRNVNFSILHNTLLNKIEVLDIMVTTPGHIFLLVNNDYLFYVSSVQPSKKRKGFGSRL